MYPVRVLNIRKRLRERIRGQLLGQSAPVVLVEDDFNDGAINHDIWHELAGVSGFPGSATIVERNGRLEVTSTQVGWMKGIQLNDPIELNNSVISLDLEQSNYNVVCISIIPDGSPFIMQSSPDAYTYRIWSEDASPPIAIYRNGIPPVFSKDWVNPAHLEIKIEGGEIIFLEDGVEIYREAYQISSTFATIVLWGQSQYLNVGGRSWFDNFMVETVLPDLTIAVDKSIGYLGDIFTFSGILNDHLGAPIQEIVVNLIKRKVIQQPTIYPMPDEVQFPHSVPECYTGKDNQISPCAEIWHYAVNVVVDVEVWMSPGLGENDMFATLQECRDALDVSYPLGSPENAGTDLTNLGGAYDIPWTADEKGTFQFYSETVI